MNSSQQYIWDRVIPEPNSGCWLWALSDGSHGYPQCTGRDRVMLAHRASYMAFVGNIDGGMEIDHKCRNRCCVNPDYLEQVTKEENRKRQGAAVTHCPRGHELSGDNVIWFTAKFNDEKRQHLNGRKYRGCRTCANERRRKMDTAGRA